MVLHKPYTAADESKLVTADRNRIGLPTLALPDAAEAFSRMKSAAERDGVGLIAFSGYRSFNRQKELFADAQRRHGRRGAARWVAPPGYSEHQTGLALDIGDLSKPETDDESTFEETAAHAWLCAGADRFGFEMSFLRNNPQGVGYEPWHWRFVGTHDARAVFSPTGAIARFRRAVQAYACAVRLQVLP